jgi:hypothetical protein
MSVSMSVRWDHKPVDHMDVAKILTGWADDIGPTVLDALKSKTPVRTGRMRQSTRYSRTSSTGVRLEFRAYTKYAQWVIGGAGPHIIEAKATRALRWSGGAFGPGMHFAKLVHHPGNKANHYPQEVLDSLKDEIIANLKDRIDSALRGDS